MSRLMKRKWGLELEVMKMREDAAQLVNKERMKWEKQVADMKAEASTQRELLKESQSLVTIAEQGKQQAVDTLAVQREATRKLESVVAELTGKNEELTKQLRMIPSKEVVIAEFKAGDSYKSEVVAARLAGIAAYKASAEFEDELRVLSDRAVAEYKEGPIYAAEVEKMKSVGRAEYLQSVAFRQAVGLEAGKMSRQVVECCREFFKDDLRRAGGEFGDFFVTFMRRQRVRETGVASSLGSVVKSST